MTDIRLGRRAFLSGSALMLGGGVSALSHCELQNSGSVRVEAAMVTDLHYADKPAAGSRHYRATLDKLDEAINKLSERKISFAIELGDFVDAADTVSEEQRYLERISRSFSKLAASRHHVLGNHCVHTLTKPEFLGTVGQDKSYYSFDLNGFHFIVLDACFRNDNTAYGRKNFVWTDSNIPPSELDWLRGDLGSNDLPTIVFVHQRLDVSNQYGIKNAGAVRALLEQTRNVIAVFQGHSHKNDYNEINGIHYCTHVAMVEGSGVANNAYSLLRAYDNGKVELEGFRKQKSHQWTVKG